MEQALRQPFVDASEWPLVSREDCWRAYRPTQGFSESAFQRLRREGVISSGVRISSRVGARLAGQQRCFSRLNLLALEAYRTGGMDEARNLSSLAQTLEARHDVRLLVTALTAAVISAADTGPLPMESAGLIRRVCVATDSYHAESQVGGTRLAALVRESTAGLADLVLQQGDHILYSQAKLAHIGRDAPGSLVFLYIFDLGGTDSLMRARPGVSLTAPADLRDALTPGAFDRVVTRVDGEQATAIDELMMPTETSPAVDLTGLRIR